MPSSTSSSNDRLPAGPWGKPWAAALLAGGLLLAGYEAYWRGHGFVPQVTDDAGLWGLVRSEVAPDDPDEAVLVGASRIQLDVNTATFAEAFGGGGPRQLAVQGSVCLPALDHLSRDSSFRGVVVCDLVPGILSGRSHLSWPEKQQEYGRKYDDRAASALLEQRLRVVVQTSFAFRLGDVSPQGFLTHLVRGTSPRPAYFVILPDRSVQADYSRADIRLPPGDPDAAESLVDDEVVARHLAELGEMVGRIEGRGGAVVFVRMPSSGNTLRREEKEFPRAREGDRLAERFPGRTVHFADYPSLAGFQCPDESHLDYRDAVPFTRALAAILRDRLGARAPRISRGGLVHWGER